MEQLNIPHDNLDKSLHIKTAAQWLCRAQDAGNDRGVSWGIRSNGSFLPSYPETTGYIIPTFLKLSQYFEEKSFLDRAILMGNWLLNIQLECGAVRGGVEDGSPPKPVIFNTGQVVLGLCKLYSATGDEKFLIGARQGADWMLKNQSEDGAWRNGLSDFCLKIVNIYNVNCTLGFIDLTEFTGDSRYLEAAIKSARFALNQQNDRGWFSKCCLDDPGNPLLHIIAYTVAGLLDIGCYVHSEEIISRAKLTADSILDKLDQEGYLPGCFLSNWSHTVNWCCLTGSAQISVIWSKLYHLGGEEKYRDAVKRVNEYLMRHHDISSEKDILRGGITGSFPVDGEYLPFCMLNWAAKYFIDALLEVESL